MVSLEVGSYQHRPAQGARGGLLPTVHGCAVACGTLLLPWVLRWPLAVPHGLVPRCNPPRPTHPTHSTHPPPLPPQVRVKEYEGALREYKRENGKFFEMKERYKAAIAGLEREVEVRGAQGCLAGWNAACRAHARRGPDLMAWPCALPSCNGWPSISLHV